MAVLSTEARKRISKISFGLPTKRAYPVENASHARNALARASQQYNAGNLSGSEKAEIDRKAHAKLKDSK